MSDAMLEYLKSIDDKATRIEDKLDAHGDRIVSLETTREKQRFMMAIGGFLVTSCSGLTAWIFGGQK